MELNSEGIQLNIIYVWITFTSGNIVASINTNDTWTQDVIFNYLFCKIKNKIHIDNREV